MTRRQYFMKGTIDVGPGTRPPLTLWQRVQWEGPETIYRGQVVHIGDEGQIRVKRDGGADGESVRLHLRDVLIVPAEKAEPRDLITEARSMIEMVERMAAKERAVCQPMVDKIVRSTRTRRRR